jgi:lysophospholipase L1-like esterase
MKHTKTANLAHRSIFLSGEFALHASVLDEQAPSACRWNRIGNLPFHVPPHFQKSDSMFRPKRHLQNENSWVGSIWSMILATSFLGSLFEPAWAQGHLPESKRIVFLGDSITYAGGYISTLEAAILRQHPDSQLELLNLGLPSETVSGLSEPGHAGGQFPRPDLHERLARVLDQTKPDLVIACYGMNDGIYYPLSDSRFAAFQSGMTRMHEMVIQSGAKLIHLTPAFFDALPIQDRLLPEGLESYPQPYAHYDDVLEAYSKWLMGKQADDWIVLDLHSVMKNAVLENRKADPKFTFASDGVHPNTAGQSVIAKPLASAWGISLFDDASAKDPRSDALLAIVAEKQNTLKLAWLSATGHKRPGIQTGLPLGEAQTRASELDRKARDLITSPVK